MGAAFEGSLILCASVSGMVIYKDLEHQSWYTFCLYSLALLGIVVGILTVAIGCFRPEDTEDAETATKSEELGCKSNEMAPDPSNATSQISKAPSQGTASTKSTKSITSVRSQMS